jgi:hypothetical protein
MEKILKFEYLQDSHKHFPCFVNKREIIYFIFKDNEPFDAYVEFMLYEYTKDKKSFFKRWRHTTKWKKNWTLAFNPTSDYTLKRGIGYKLQVTYKNNSNEVITDDTYFQL